MEYIDTIKNILTILAVIIPLLAHVLKKVPKTWLKAIGISILAGVLTYGIILVVEEIVVVDKMNGPPPEITILDPKDGSIIDCQKISDDEQCIYTVRGEVSKLKANQKLYVLIKEKGGDEWWVSGGAIQLQDIVNNVWEQPWASFGHKDSPVKDYLVCAIVTHEQYISAQKFRSFPECLNHYTISIKRK